MPSPNITTSGNILSDDFIELMREADWTHEATRPEKFAPPGGPSPKSVGEDLAAAYELLRDRWEEIRVEVKEYDRPRLRARWVTPLLNIFDFNPVYLPQRVKVGEADDAPSFRLTHRGWKGNGAPIVHSIAWKDNFDERRSKKRGAYSPHETLQRYLNLSPDQWGVIINGRKLRILRDYHHSLTKGYVEIDLEGIFESGDIGDFRALYRLAHVSRFISDSEGVCPLEKFYKTSHEVGVEVGKQLRSQVKEAIEILANGFLDGDLIAELQADAERCSAYYREILHLVYRLLFLLFAEQKGWLPMKDPLYVESYSVSGLRDRAHDPNAARDEHLDLWEGLKITFRLVRDGFDFHDVTVPAYGGQLFDDDKHFLTLRDRTLKNCDLLAAIHKLSFFPRKKVLHKINYTLLQVDALGSVYESLLDYTPRVLSAVEEIDGVQRQAGELVLDPRGAARKTTGSYYTDRRLVAELIDSALRPVVADRLRDVASNTHTPTPPSARTSLPQEAALLSIKVCDPACGSGAFLTAAMDALGQELAKIRCADEQPTDDDLRRARRDVLQHCIYGVDLNPMAVELAKVSLWIAAAMPNMPLTFLDHRIKCGDSLIGATPELIEAGIPDEAFKPVTGDDKDAAKILRKRNKEERTTGQTGLFGVSQVIEDDDDLDLFRRLNAIGERTARAVAEKEEIYETWHKQSAERLPHRLADLWTAAFFWKIEKNCYLAPTHGVLRSVAGGGQLDPRIGALVVESADDHRFFHWHLEFPDVFGADGAGGFDCVLGNPPWERIKLQEKEFFAARDPGIANAPNAAERKRTIKELKESNPELLKEFEQALRMSESESLFLRNSARFPLAGRGDINTYAVFAEASQGRINARGRVGIIVPSGIATDNTTKEFFQDLTDKGSLASLYDFENREGIFPGVHRGYKFCLLTLTGSDAGAKSADFAFFLTNVDDLNEEERHFTLSVEEIELLNPNTKTCPIFRSKRDAELTKEIYRRVPVLVKEVHDNKAKRISESNPWGVKYLRMIDMANDSHLFLTRDELERQKFELKGNIFRKGNEEYLPLYEAKMTQPYDHRAADVVLSAKATIRQGQPDALSVAERQNPKRYPLPRYWVESSHVLEVLPDSWKRRWLLGFTDVTSSTNERTMLATVIPLAAVGHTMPLIFPLAAPSAKTVSALCGSLNSFIFDYLSRQKMGGTHYTYFLLKQMPILTSDMCSDEIVEHIVARVLELSYTAWDLKPFAEDCDYDGPPFPWDEERRAQLRAELDAIYFHLYGISRENTDYILDTFPIVRRKDEAKHGEYRTKRMILEKYDEYAGVVASPAPSED